MNRYKLVEGYDQCNRCPLYQCTGVNNDYVGPWHTQKVWACRELEELELSQNIELNNGQVARFVIIDYWSRPQYDISFKGKLIRVCCINLDGTYLPTMSSDFEEPISALNSDFQPVPKEN